MRKSFYAENNENTPVYNVNNFNDVKKNESFVRNDRASINTHSYESDSFNERGYSSNSFDLNKDAKLDISSTVNKSVDYSHELKALANQNNIEKPYANANSAEIISTTSKSGALDKPIFQLPVNSELKNVDEVAQQINWARNNHSNHVKIALAPEHLGALEINIEQDADGLNIQFTTQNAIAKEAIETFLPRLKDMLEQQGLNLQNANVSQQDSGNNSNTYDQTAEHLNAELTHDEQSREMQVKDNNDVHKSNHHLLEAFA